MAVKKISYPPKRSGDLWGSSEVNEVKDVVNSNADELSALQEVVASLPSGGSGGSGGMIAVVEQTGQSVSVAPGVKNVWQDPVSSLSITLQAGGSGVNEYMLQFTVGGSSFTLTLPSVVRWASEPDWSAGSTYQVSIEDNLAIGAGWEALEG